MKRLACGVLICFGLNGLTLAGGPLRVHPDNPLYFTDDGRRAIYLTGSHVWANLRDGSIFGSPVTFDYAAYLDFLEDRGHNFFRLWTWELPRFTVDDRTFTVAPFPWLRTGPGPASDGMPKFDLARFDQSYFDRLRARVKAASDRGIYVAIMLFDGYGLQFYRSPSTDGFPFDARNNINGIDAPGTSATTLDYPEVTAVQEAYVRKVIDTVNDLDNVLYEIANEAGAHSTEWQYHMVDVVKTYEATKPKQHPVGMTFQYEGGSNETLFDSPADWISPNEEGGYKEDPPIPDGRKVVIADTDHLWGEGGDGIWVWKCFTRGLHILFMDGGIVRFPPSADGRESARQAMGQTLSYAVRMDLAAMRPQADSSVCSTRFCLTHPGQEYLVYQPESGAFTLDVTGGTYAYEWFNPSTGSVVATGQITVTDGVRVFSPPFPDNAVLYLKRAERF